MLYWIADSGSVGWHAATKERTRKGLALLLLSTMWVTTWLWIDFVCKEGPNRWKGHRRRQYNILWLHIIIRYIKILQSLAVWGSSIVASCLGTCASCFSIVSSELFGLACWRHLATPAAAAKSEIAKLTTCRLLCTLDTAKEQPNMWANWVETAACGWVMCCQIKYDYILSNDLANISSALQYQQAVVYSWKHRTKGIETGWSLSTINVVFCPESMALEDSKIWSRQIALESVRVSAASYHIV